MNPSPEQPQYGLDEGGGSGSSGHFERSFFLWPLPTLGTLAVVCEWSELGIAETVTQLDTEPIVAAGRRAHPLWEEDAGLPSHHNFTAGMVAMHQVHRRTEDN